MTIAEFIAEHELTLCATQADSNPNVDPGGWAKGATHWNCVISSPTRGALVIPFSQGSAHKGPPDLATVLDCLASDARTVEYDSFEEWAGNLGYDTDSRSAERTYRTVKTQSERLLEFLGNDAFNTLLDDVEPL
jgi:hypothetical protein